jgi:hypothetical protein
MVSACGAKGKTLGRLHGSYCSDHVAAACIKTTTQHMALHAGIHCMRQTLLATRATLQTVAGSSIETIALCDIVLHRRCSGLSGCWHASLDSSCTFALVIHEAVRRAWSSCASCLVQLCVALGLAAVAQQRYTLASQQASAQNASAQNDGRLPFRHCIRPVTPRALRPAPRAGTLCQKQRHLRPIG